MAHNKEDRFFGGDGGPGRVSVGVHEVCELGDCCRVSLRPSRLGRERKGYLVAHIHHRAFLGMSVFINK